MRFWDNLKDKTSELSEDLKTKVSKFKNADFADASMAMCALIAAADGTIDSSERQKTAAFITSNSTLRIFDVSELRTKFDHYCNRLQADYDFGKIEAIQSISKLRKKQDQARAVIQVGIIIGGADGNFDDNEKGAVCEACFAVGISPSEFDLEGRKKI
ncbi:tellurite resistance TerB family protein [Thermodesulfovibrionales bacterium]|nr:tellurite resistance TerB family protein [Thermodesulfovibrionales bacterium]